MISLANYPNTDAAVIKLLQGLSVSADPAAISAELEKHPDYPGLLAISDILSNLDIQNIAFTTSFEELALVKPQPFIAHTYTNGGEFLIIDRIKGDNIYVSSEKWIRHKMSMAEFKKIFSGVVLTAEAPDNISASYSFTKTLRKVKTSLVITSLLLIIAAGLTFNADYFNHFTWQILLLTSFKSAGLIISILLLLQAIDSNNPLIQKFCQAGSKTDCNAILSSKAAKIFESLSWSEVGFFYFAGTWLALLFGGHSLSLLQTLAILNILSLPYTLYSIYYQARVAKQWCILCCIIQALLWLEFIPSITALESPFILPGNAELSTLFIASIFPVILWILLKPLFLKVQLLQPLKQQLHKFKYNTGLFNTMLSVQPKYALPAEEWSIVLGDMEATNSITMVSNPYCAPCSRAHKLLDELLNHCGNIQARIVFTANNSEDDIITPVARHLMALNELPDKSIVKMALTDWYQQKQKDYKTWAKVYPVELKESEYYKIDYQKNWCNISDVTGTPTLLLNGYRLPEFYQLSDLKYMLD